MKTTWLIFSPNSSKRSGRLSIARRQPEAVLDERVLAGAVALVLAVELRHGDVALVEDDEEVVREVVEQRVRRLAGGATVEVARVVLDPGARPDLAHHLEVVRGAHAQALRLEQLAAVLEPLEPVDQLDLDVLDRAAERSSWVT